MSYALIFHSGRRGDQARTAGHSCFPVARNKHPTCPHGFKDASTDDGDLRELWSKYPGELIGVATGTPSQIAVIDLDKKHPESMFWFHTNVDNLPRTRIHKTRTGGLHLIYGHYDGLRCSTLNIPPMRQPDGKSIPGVEIKANGGCCTWWPAAGYPLPQDAPIAPWPEFLVPQAPKPREPRPAELKGDLDYALRRAEGLIRTVATAPNGERNRVLFWAGRCLAEMIADNDINGPACRDVYEDLVRAAVHRGLDRREAVTTLRSAAHRRAA